MSKRVAVVQSNYIPWKGYFDLIHSVDEFILFDDMQYTRRDWRNRNRIKTAQGIIWLTIPVQVKGGYQDQRICDTVVSDAQWNLKHWKTLSHHYAKARCFPQYKDRFKELYLGATDDHLSAINHRFLTAICEMLGISTRFTWSMDYSAGEGKTQRLIELCQQAGATEYISGPSAKAYIDEEQFAQSGVSLRYMEYGNYPEYRQLNPPFDHAVSIVDLILNEGPDARTFMKSF